MNQQATIINRGRGPQLSTSRITVLDLVPYFQAGCSHDEIKRWMPTLSDAEIEVVAQYYLKHKQELDDQDRRVCEHREEQIRLQRLRFPESQENSQEHFNRLKKLLKERQEKNGEGASG